MEKHFFLLVGSRPRGGNSSHGLHSGARGGGSGFSGVCAGSVCGLLGGVGVPLGVGLPSMGVCGLSSVGGGEGCPGGGSVAGVCCCFGGWGRPVSRGPGVRAMVGVCGPPGGQQGGRGMRGDCAPGCVVSVYVSARSGALAWSVVGRTVWRRSLPSSAAAARISQTSLRIWCTSWSVVGRGYASSGLRPTRLGTLWMVWYPQVRECCVWLSSAPLVPRVTASGNKHVPTVGGKHCASTLRATALLYRFFSLLPPHPAAPSVGGTHCAWQWGSDLSLVPGCGRWGGGGRKVHARYQHAWYDDALPLNCCCIPQFLRPLLPFGGSRHVSARCSVSRACSLLFPYLLDDVHTRVETEDEEVRAVGTNYRTPRRLLAPSAALD